MTYNISPVVTKADIPEEYLQTPVGLLLEYHNLNRPYDVYEQAQLLIGMCMDSRKHMHIPDNFAYIIRSGGANLRYSEFKISYAIAVGKVEHVVLIAHNHCGMVDLNSKKDIFIEGLVQRAGWSKEEAKEHFSYFAPMYSLSDEIDFIVTEKDRLSKKYPKISFAALYYKIEDSRLYVLQ